MEAAGRAHTCDRGMLRNGLGTRQFLDGLRVLGEDRSRELVLEAAHG